MGRQRMRVAASMNASAQLLHLLDWPGISIVGAGRAQGALGSTSAPTLPTLAPTGRRAVQSSVRPGMAGG